MQFTFDTLVSFDFINRFRQIKRKDSHNILFNSNFIGETLAIRVDDNAYLWF